MASVRPLLMVRASGNALIRSGSIGGYNSDLSPSLDWRDRRHGKNKVGSQAKNECN